MLWSPWAQWGWQGVTACPFCPSPVAPSALPLLPPAPSALPLLPLAPSALPLLPPLSALHLHLALIPLPLSCSSHVSSVLSAFLCVLLPPATPLSTLQAPMLATLQKQINSVLSLPPVCLALCLAVCCNGLSTIIIPSMSCYLPFLHWFRCIDSCCLLLSASCLSRILQPL